MQCKCGHGMLEHGFANPFCRWCDCPEFRLLEPGDVLPPCQCADCLKESNMTDERLEEIRDGRTEWRMGGGFPCTRCESLAELGSELLDYIADLRVETAQLRRERNDWRDKYEAIA